jgi:hypothetical protein
MPRTSTADSQEVLVQLAVVVNEVGTLKDQMRDHAEQIRDSAVASAAQTAKIVEALGNGKPGRIEKGIDEFRAEMKERDEKREEQDAKRETQNELRFGAIEKTQESHKRFFWMLGGGLVLAEFLLKIYEATHR